jgi:hypothetical protein
MQVNDAVEHFRAVLSVDPIPQSTEIVAKVDVPARLDAGKHSNHGYTLPSGAPLTELP